VDDKFKKKVFWLLWGVVSALAYFMSFGWGAVWTIVSLLLTWWLVYKSGMM